MAKLLDETLNTIFTLQRRLLELLDEAKAAELNLFERFGETEETIPELDQLQNVTERLRNPYSRLHRILLLVAESQPLADVTTLKLLSESIEEAQTTADASAASTQEIKRNWNLL